MATEAMVVMVLQGRHHLPPTKHRGFLCRWRWIGTTGWHDNDTTEKHTRKSHPTFAGKVRRFILFNLVNYWWLVGTCKMRRRFGVLVEILLFSCRGLSCCSWPGVHEDHIKTRSLSLIVRYVPSWFTYSCQVLSTISVDKSTTNHWIYQLLTKNSSSKLLIRFFNCILSYQPSLS